MKRRPKAKPRVTIAEPVRALLVTRLARIERKFDYLASTLPGANALREHCAVLASHNRRLLEENDTLRRWLKRLQEKGAP